MLEVRGYSSCPEADIAIHKMGSDLPSKVSRVILKETNPIICDANATVMLEALGDQPQN